MFKKTIATTALASILLTPSLFGAPAQAQADASGYTVVKSFSLKGNSAAYMDHNNVMVPIRDVAQSLGWTIKWDGKAQEVKLAKGNQVIRLFPNKIRGTIGDGEPFLLTSPVAMKKGTTYAPLRVLTARMGGVTLWDAKSGTASIAIPDSSIRLAYDFVKDDGGWKTGVADLPVDYQSQDFQIKTKVDAVKLADGTTVRGMLLGGMNRSDDLFLYMTKKLSGTDGLKPNTTYEVKLRFDLATEEADGSFGVGGSPASSVYVKAGVVGKAPAVVKDDSDASMPYYRLNLDKGNQSTDGKDVALLGNVAKPNADKSGFQLKKFERTFTAKSNAAGELYVILGTDSGYEGLQTHYFTNIDLTLEAKS
ncbi:copper amine oxidase N-terminal domain-containing protein [Cohnella sp. GCM10027633]|uniref:copper amine oxidase N-terminal domain-containing protein n=1 Tax=unclassified Cohnella TaxID=2636738 RepID=UPI0036426063